jgi:hypothetical protein
LTATATATWPTTVDDCPAKIARGEAMGCAASLDVMRRRKLVSDARYPRGIHLLEGVVAMLTKML